MKKTPLEREISMIEISEKVEKELPEEVQKILNILHNEENLAIKGDIPRGIMRQLMMESRKIEISDPWDEEIKLGLIIGISEEKNKKNSLFQRVDKLKNIIALNEEKVEVIRGEKTIGYILENRNVTMDEAVLIYEEGIWRLYHTEKFRRDIILNIGFLSYNGNGTMRYNRFGERVATQYGLATLFEMYAQGKVNHLYLLQSWIDENAKKNMEKMGQPNCLGIYSLSLAYKLRPKPLWQQKKFLSLLKKFGITDAETFEDFFLEETRSYELKNGKPFKFNNNRTFEEIYKSRKGQQGANTSFDQLPCNKRIKKANYGKYLGFDFYPRFNKIKFESAPKIEIKC